ncbi:DoxX family membrane protein [Saccharothrix ecbatanensis]|uniref:DoxX family membrane protein n=1 Tax=Saccharothrix ecbatanensis TaxID=1105145 RepID=UPI0028AFF293|nr:DoxX family membrane protein [Saccharothrix ecbatanensis]
MWMIEFSSRLDAPVNALRALSIPLLRGSLGVVFVWFGALKVTGTTPVGELVAGTVPWLEPRSFVFALGLVEVALGVALMVGRRLRWVALIVVLHLCGTLLTLVVQPSVAFQTGNPLLLTITGEFLVKNLVLITAGLAIMSADAPVRQRVSQTGSARR